MHDGYGSSLVSNPAAVHAKWMRYCFSTRTASRGGPSGAALLFPVTRGPETVATADHTAHRLVGRPVDAGKTAVIFFLKKKYTKPRCLTDKRQGLFQYSHIIILQLYKTRCLKEVKETIL